MAFLVAEPIALTPTATAAANYPITLSTLGLTLVDDDWLILSVICAATSGTLSTASSGWTEITELDVTSGNRMARYKCKVASGTAANPQIDLSSGTGQWRGCVEQWRDADATDCIDSSAVSAGSNAISEATGALTPGTNNCAISYFSAGRFGATVSSSLRFKSDEIVGRLIQAADDGTVYTGIALGTVQQTTAAATAKTLYAEKSGRLGTITVAIKNKTSGGLLADSRAGITKMAWMGTFGVTHESLGTTWGAPSTFVAWTGGTINGITADTNAPTINNETAGAGKVWGTFSNIASTVNTAGAIVGGWIALPATIDLTGKFFSLEWFMSLIGGATGGDGVLLALGDSATASTGNAAVYQLAPKLSIVPNELNVSVVDPSSATTYDTEGSINLATINKVGFFYHRVGSVATSRAITVRNLLAIANSVLVGGNVGKPVDIRFLDVALNGWGYTGICQKLGDAVLVKTDVQFGDGTVPTYVDTTATLLNTPAAYSAGTQPFWNAGANSITVGMKAASGDTMNFIASAMAAGAGAEQSFTIDAATSATGNYSFQGEVISNFLFTGDTDVPIVGATYSGDDEVAFKGADVTNVTISTPTSANAACSFDANGVVVDSCTISCVKADGTSIPYHMAFGASLTAITINSSTLSGSPSTDKFYSALASGTLTITTDGLGTSLVAGDVTFVGGSTANAVIAAPAVYQKVIVSGQTAGSRIQIYDTTNSIELFNGTVSAGDTVVSGTVATWTDPTAAAGNRAIRVRVAYVNGATAKMWQENTGLTCGTSSTTYSVTYPITQVADTTYDSNAVTGSAVTGITFTDAATDLVNINIAADTTPLKDIYAAFVYWLFTAAGIDDDVAYIDAPDPANYIMTSMKFRNTSTDPLKITGGYFYDSTGSVENCVDVAGSSGNIYPMPAHVVPYQTTGTYAITGDIADIPSYVAGTAVDGSTTLAESLRLANAVLGGKVSGAGTGTETFRNLADTKNRVVATVDSSGNRTAITRDLT